MYQLTEEIKTGISTAQKWIDGAKNLIINDSKTYDLCVRYLKNVKTEYSRQEDARKKMVKPINDHVSWMNAQFKPTTTALKNSEEILKDKIGDWDHKKEIERQEAQRKADEAARKERERIEVIARKEREKEEEQLRKAAEARKRAEETADEEEKAKALREAEKADSRAESAASKADLKESIASTVVAPTVIKESTTKGKGISFTKKYTCEVVDKAEFVRECLERGDLYLLDVNLSALNKEAQASKGMRSWKGIKVNFSTNVGSRK